MRRSLERLLFALALVASPSELRAQEASTSPPAESAPEVSSLARYYTALAERRLVAPEQGSQSQLADLVVRGQAEVLERRFDDAALTLFEAVESPRFTDFEGSDDFSHAEYLLGDALFQLGAERTAAHYLLRLLSGGPETPFFGPAYRKLVDVALAGAELPHVLEGLEALGEAGLSEDSLNELRYLRARARYDADELEAADALFAEVGRRSRFYANAQYLRGVIATRGARLADAEGLFCSIATTPDTDRFSFYVDRRYFDVRDLTWLALGRVAHEGGRANDAFYYYFQVPADSRRVAEALFEGAWAMYEGHDAETAVDLLDQLEARFPASPFVDEAMLLRGYIHLDRCEFEEANRLFIRFAETFGPLREEAERILATESRRARIVEELLALEDQGEGAPPPEGGVIERPSARAMLLGLLRVDPTFFRLDAELRALDAEAARSARLADQIGAIEVRLEGGDAPEAAAPAVDGADDEAASARRELEAARTSLRMLVEQLDAMRASGATPTQLEPLEADAHALEARLSTLESDLARAIASAGASEAASAGADRSLEGALREDRRAARAFPGRVAAARSRLVGVMNAASVRALEELVARLGTSLRRARIGRIDAVMGSKRRIEIQIESLSAGRFPPELLDPLRIQGLLRDDEEYWPFEGELWRDEFEEDEADDDASSAAAPASATSSDASDGGGS